MVDVRGQGVFVLASSLGHLLHRAQQIAADHFAEAVGDPKLTLRQFALLAAIAEQAGRSQTELVRATGIDRSTLADMIGRLESRGLVKRRGADKDRRAKSVTLTPTGAATLTAATPGAEAADRKLMDLVPARRRDAFVDALRTLAATPAPGGELEEPARRPKVKDRAPARTEAPPAAAKKRKAGKAEKQAKAEDAGKTAARAEKPGKLAKAAKTDRTGKSKAEKARIKEARAADKRRKKR